MGFVSMIFNFIAMVQAGCGGCAPDGTGSPPSCLPCCSRPGGCGPPPPPGFPLDNYIYILFFAALVLGVYIIQKNKRLLQS